MMQQEMKFPMQMSFKVNVLRVLASPFGKEVDPTQKTYIAYARAVDLPDGIPMETNPRMQNTSTKVAKRIKHTLVDSPESIFHLLNRGILFSAESVKFNNETNVLTMTFSDPLVHGNVDGGHTYKIICDNKNDIPTDRYVKIQIMTGIEDCFEQLASAHNTAVPVHDKAIAELEGKFEFIKSAIVNEPWAKNVAFKQNEERFFDEKDIDITDVIAVLAMFNLKKFNQKSHPVQAFSGKGTTTKMYLDEYNENDNPFKKMVNIIPDIFRLYDHIEEKMPKMYNKTGDDGKPGRFGALRGVVYKKGEAFHKRPFSDGKYMKYEAPKAYLYPMVAAFRALVEIDPATGMYKWTNGYDPIAVFDEIGEDMIDKVTEQAKQLGNPNSVGKSSTTWDLLYKDVLLTKFQ